jgi:hypothetical protein
MNTSELGYKEYKCHHCGWVHAAIPLQAVPDGADMQMYQRCFSCRGTTAFFLPASAGDAPDGCTLQPVVVPGVWDDFFTDGPKVSDDFMPGDGK